MLLLLKKVLPKMLQQRMHPDTTILFLVVFYVLLMVRKWL